MQIPPLPHFGSSTGCFMPHLRSSATSEPKLQSRATLSTTSQKFVLVLQILRRLGFWLELKAGSLLVDSLVRN